MRPLAQALAAGAASAACFCAGDALAAAAAASGFPACDAPVLLSAIPETGLAAEPMALAVGLMAACIPWAVWARSLVRAGTYRQGEEHGSARWGTLKEGRAFMDRKDKANNILLSRDFALVLALPQNQPNAPLYPAGGAPGSRPGALPHFGRPRYLGPPPRARSTAG